MKLPVEPSAVTLITLTLAGQLRFWRGEPHGLDLGGTHVDSMGKNLILHVYCNPKECPDAFKLADKFAEDNGLVKGRYMGKVQCWLKP